MSNYKLVITDVDGTLVDHAQRVPQRNSDAIDRVRELGVVFSLATGRMPQSAQIFIDRLNVTAPCIVYNGCSIIDFDGTELFSRSLPPEVAVDALEIGNKHGFTVFAYQNNRILVEKMDPRVRAQEHKDGVNCTPVGDLRTRLTASPTKLLLVGEVESAPKVRDSLLRHFGVTATVVRSEPNYVEVLPPGVNKGEALRELCKILGIELENVIAIGDNLNDLEMLKLAGIGVAPSNAETEVRAIADFVTDADNEAGAVAEAIERTVTATGAN